MPKTAKTPAKGSKSPAKDGKGSKGATKSAAKAPTPPAPVTEADAAAEELRALWDDFKATGSGAARERLILHYAPLVKYVASRVATGLPATVEQADLVSYGMFGLIDALHAL